MTTLQLRIVFWAVVAGLVLAGGVIWLKSRDNNREIRDDVEQADRTATATTGIATDAAAATENVHRTEVIVTDSRATYMRDYADAKRDSTVADWADQPVPPRLRELARARREARERSGGDGDGGQGAAPTP